MRILLLLVTLFLLFNTTYASQNDVRNGVNHDVPIFILNAEKPDSHRAIPNQILYLVATDSTANEEPLPKIEIDAESFVDTLYQGQASEHLFRINNIGDHELEVSLSVEGEDEEDKVLWASKNITDASIEPDKHQAVNIMFDTNELSPGYYNTTLYINSNDPENEEVTLTADLLVLEPVEGKLQIIHNSADPGIGRLLLRINEEQVDNNFTYRSATGTIDLPPYDEVHVSLSEPGNNGEVVLDTLFTAQPGEFNQLIISGVTDPDEFSDNPFIDATGLNFIHLPNVADEAESNQNVLLQWVHGVTDGGSLLAEISREYSQEFEAYRQVNAPVQAAAMNYEVKVYDSATEMVIEEMELDLSDSRGQAITVFLTGFLEPGANKNGDRISFYAINRDGERLDGKVVVDEEEENEDLESDRVELFANYPNPFNPTTSIEFSLPESQHVRLEVFDITGRHITTLVDREVSAGTHSRTWNASNAASGIYLSRLQVGNVVRIQQMHLIK